MRTALLAVLATSACTTASPQAEQPAVLVAPTLAARAELHEVIGLALNNPQLTLADDALTRESVLILERVPRRDAGGVLLDGRELAMPERFILFAQESRCVLMHERSGRRWYLRHAQCKPVAAGAP